MTINQNEYKSKVGLDQLHIAEVTQDDSVAYVADTPEYFAPAAEAGQEPSSSMDTQYADDQPYDVMTSEGPTKITLTITGLPLEMLAKITGRVFDATTGRLYDNGGSAPYFALSFRSLKSGGGYRYYQYLKGMFSSPKDDSATKGEKAEPKLTTVEFTAIRTVHQFDLGDINDSVKRVVGDTDTTSFSATNWFTTVQVPGVAAVSALALSTSTPADDATGVSKTANQTLTFNNALIADAVNNVTLLDDAQAVVAGTITLDATKKIITIDPTATLTGSKDYTIVIGGVKDVYGQTLTSIVTFTTAA